MSGKFEFLRTDFEGAYFIKPFVSRDERGSLIKDYSKEEFKAAGIRLGLEETFYTVSKKGTIRALHFQRKYEQPKLVRCVSGRIFDVIVDLRPESLTFKHWQGFYLSGDSNLEIYVPEHFAHGYLVLEPSVVAYKCGEKFYPEFDDGIIYNDPDINVAWPFEEIGGEARLIISEKDGNLKALGKRFVHFIQ